MSGASAAMREGLNWFSGLDAVWSLLERRDRRRLAALLVLMIFAAVGQMVTISMVVPFLGLALNPSYVQSNRWLRGVYSVLEMQSNQQFLFWLGLGVVAAILLTNAATLLV